MYNTARKETEGTAYDAIHASYWLECELNSKVNAFERFQAEQFPTESPSAPTSGIIPDKKRLMLGTATINKIPIKPKTIIISTRVNPREYGLLFEPKPTQIPTFGNDSREF